MQPRIVAALRQCLEASKAFLEIFTSLDISDYQRLSAIQWTQLVQVMKVVPKLCFDDTLISQWNTAEARSYLQLNSILESLCGKMQELTSTTSQTASDGTSTNVARPDYFLMFKSVLQIMKEEYDQRVAALERNVAEQKTGSRCPVLNGSIRTSEFWDAWQYSDTVEEDLMNIDFDDFDFDIESTMGSLDWSTSEHDGRFEDWDMTYSNVQ